MKTKKKKLPLIDWEPIDFLGNKKEVYTPPTLPDEHHRIVVKILKRSELATIPRDRYVVTVLATMSEATGGGEEKLMVLITEVEKITTQLKDLRYDYRSLVWGGNGSGSGTPPTIKLFLEPIDEHKMADCIIQVMDGFFHGADKCTIGDNDYTRMEFCVLMHIFFKKINFLKKKSRLSFSKFLQDKVFAGKSGFIRSYNTYADKPIYKDFEKQLDINKYRRKNHPDPIPPDIKYMDYHQRMMLNLSSAFQKIYRVFQKSPYFMELQKLQKTILNFVLD